LYYSILNHKYQTAPTGIKVMQWLLVQPSTYPYQSLSYPTINIVAIRPDSIVFINEICNRKIIKE
jgi:hypothetical protein